MNRSDGSPPSAKQAPQPTQPESPRDQNAGTVSRPIGMLSDRQASLRAVDRAMGDLRRGDFVLVRPDRGPALLAVACENASDAVLTRLAELSGGPLSIAITLQRAIALGLAEARTADPAGGDAAEVAAAGVMTLTPGTDAPSAGLVRALADPLERVAPSALDGLQQRIIRPDPVTTSQDGALATVRLAKLARLLPAVVVAPIDRPLGVERLLSKTDCLSVTAFDIDQYEDYGARSLYPVARARVPLDLAHATEVVAFRPTDGGQEHLAIVIGSPDTSAPVLIRLHSECFTGDLLGSMRCDCGEQLRGAIAEIARSGSGVLLYLAQEGRGIGLINKLRAYRLQDDDFDTVDANEMLGYDADERIYRPAVRMLDLLGVESVRLLTNNPDKVAQLQRFGIDVAERVAHEFPANGHNEFYLRTKRDRSGHILL